MNRPLFFIVFLTVLMVLAGSAAIFDPAAKAGQVVQGESQPVVSQPVSRSAGAPEELERPDQILQRLLEAPTPVIAPTIPGQRALPRGMEPTPRLSAKIASGEKLLPEGYYISNRRGRLIRQESKWLFVFEADSLGQIDQPLVLLPNRWLEKMEADSAGGTRSIVFRVSGEITEYHNGNYLLLRRLLIEKQVSSSLRR